jgi:PAS domain S-box-containing protein
MRKRVIDETILKKDVLESLDHPLYVIDVKDYSLLFYNPKTKRFDEQETPRTCYALTHGKTTPCSGEKHPCPIEEVKRLKKSVVVEHIQYDLSGQPRLCKIHCDPIFNELGEVELVVEYIFDITDKIGTEEAISKLTHDLGERIKELNCLYQLSSLMKDNTLSLETFFSKVVALIPPAWQWPEVTCGQIKYGDLEVKTENFQETSWKQAAEIILSDTKTGVVEVFYLEETIECDEGPFLSEERELINIIARELGDYITKKEAEEERERKTLMDSTLARLSKGIISTMSIKDISNLVLESAKEVTTSKYGYVGYIDPKTSFLVSITMTKDIWGECEVPDKSVVFEKYVGLWGWVLDNHEPLLTNDPSADPRSGGTPEGHIKIRNFLSVPAMMDNKLVGQIALANSDRAYTEDDITNITRLANLYALAINNTRTDRALRESERKYRSITEISQEIIMRVLPNGVWTYLNRFGREFFGLTTEMTDKRDFFKFLHSADRKQTRLILEKITHEKSNLEDQLITVDVPSLGTRVIKWNMSPIIDESNNVIEIQATGRDVTQLQEELIEKDKLAAVGQLAAGIAHEINNPLANIDLTAEIILDLIKNDKKRSILDTESLRGELRDIKDDIKVCTRIVNDLLHFSRRIYLTPTRFPLEQAITEVINSPFMSTQLHEKGIEIELNLPPGLNITGDRALLMQVFQNILNNSIDAL